MKKSFILAILALFITTGLFSNAEEAKARQRGGTLKVVTGSSPQVLGYYPEMGPFDHGACFPAIECIMELDKDREYKPFLASSVDLDPRKKTFTIRLRKGITFTDGSELDADAAAWNYKLLKDTGKLQYGNLVKSVEVKDKYTVVLKLKEYNNQLMFGLGWVPMFSKAAYEKNGKEWCRTHPVCTGPFKLIEFKRDVHTRWVRNENYWQKAKGYPYLDGVDIRFILDSTTASAIFQAKEADMWIGPPIREQALLAKTGYKVQSGWGGLPYILYLNTTSPTSPTFKKKVREAIEYAIDRKKLAKALGYGFWTPLTTIAPPGEWGYDKDAGIRSYNPKKAKQLLTESGYPNGLKIQLLALPEAGGRNPAAEAVKSFMDQAGFNVTVDMADPGRFFNSVFNRGWNDIVLFMCGTDYNYLATIQAWFGHAPKTNLARFKRPSKLISLSEKAIKYRDKDSQERITKRIVKLISDQALMIPLYFQPSSILIHPWVHTQNANGYGLGRWPIFMDYMDSH
ncbi:MAG: ABC transporter substrate-binding protein [Spirochaetes bacterium]|nr:ABC transporter substrate-binding protein [Spirochaetota bacterium]